MRSKHGDELEGIGPDIDRIADDWTQGGRWPAWPVKTVATKYRTVEAVRKVVDTALDLAGGHGTPPPPASSACSVTPARPDPSGQLRPDP